MHALLNRLLLWQKFTLMGLFSLILIATPLILFVNESNKSIQAADDKVHGLAPSRAVLKVVVLIQQHRGLSAMALSGNETAQTQRAAKQDEVSKAFQAADAIVLEASDTGIKDRWQDAKNRWSPLPGKVAQKALSTKESFAEHTALIAHLMKTSEMLGDRFGLLLDTRAESYHLADAALLQSPVLMETLGRMRARGSALLTEKAATAEDRAIVMAMVDKANDRYDAIAAAIEKAAAANPALKQSLIPAQQAALAVGKQALQLAQDHIVKADPLEFAAPDYFAKVTEAIGAQLKFYDLASDTLEKTLQDRRSTLTSTKYLLIGIVMLLSAIVGVIGLLVSRSVTVPISEAVNVARRVASGDLGTHIDVRHGGEAGQLLQALQDMNNGLVHIVSEVRSGTDTIASASEQIAAGNIDLSSRTEEQAASVEETSSSVSEIAGTVRRNAESAHQANQLAHSAADVAVRGGSMMSHVVKTMSTINDSSRRIFDIIGVIDSIAFQTNILALNAAVEAARAGEQGKGFAVVAAEVRNLAQRSSAAAKEISELIRDSVEKVNTGTQLATETGDTMEEIVTGIKQVAHIVAEIAAASSEQQTGIEQVNEAMQQMDKVTQQNAALVEEAASAAEALQEQAQGLAQAVSVFRLQAGYTGGAPRLG